MRIVIYESAEPLTLGERFMAFLVQEAQPDGNADSYRSCLLPVRFTAETALGARNRALAFWDDETAKATARKERGKALGKSRRVAVATASGAGRGFGSARSIGLESTETAS